MRTRDCAINTLLTSKQVDTLLNKLCVELGFCLPPDDILRLKEHPPATVETFVAAVYEAEGLDLIMSSYELQKQVRKLVSNAFSTRLV